MANFLTNFSFSGKDYLKDNFLKLINRAGELGLQDTGKSFPPGSLENEEYGVILNNVVKNLYEQRIKIDREFYDLVRQLAAAIDVNEGEFSFLKELIAP